MKKLRGFIVALTIYLIIFLGCVSLTSIAIVAVPMVIISAIIISPMWIIIKLSNKQ